MSLLLAGPSRTLALAPTLSISPSKFDLIAIPGQLQESVVKITNKSDISLPIHTEVMDFAPKDARGGIDFGRSLPGRSAKEWFQLQNTDFILEPNETQSVTVRVSPPEDINDGSYFAVVMFQTNLPPELTSGDSGTTTTIVPWIGALYLLRVGDFSMTDDSLVISQTNFPRLSRNNNIPIKIGIKNTTNFHIAPETEIKLKNVLGQTLATAKIEPTTIMPQEQRELEATITNKAPLGFFIAGAQLKVNNWQKETNLGPLYLVTWIGGLLLILVFLFHFYLVKHHRKIRTIISKRARANSQPK